MSRMVKQLLRGVIVTCCILIYTQISYAQGPAGFTKAGSVPAPTLTFTDASLSPSVVLEYAVTAVNANGESGPSNIVIGTTPSTVGTHTATLTWAASPGATSYNVYRLQIVAVPSIPADLVVTTQ